VCGEISINFQDTAIFVGQYWASLEKSRLR
jgi:hypothetical protein